MRTKPRTFRQPDIASGYVLSGGPRRQTVSLGRAERAPVIIVGGRDLASRTLGAPGGDLVGAVAAGERIRSSCSSNQIAVVAVDAR